jgi:hypothetical protein
MKTVCPNCHQKYDVSSESIRNEITCEKCRKNFVAEPAIFCTECGTSNSTKDEICFRCGEKLESGARTEGESPRKLSPSDCEAVPQMKKEPPKVEPENCPVCKGKISPLASVCPHCGHPQPGEVNRAEGIVTAVGMVFMLVIWIICWTSILNPRSSSGVLFVATLFGIIISIAYLGIWLVYLIAALRRNEIGKIILLTLLPGIGIIICSFFPPKSWSTPAYSKGVQIR